MNTTRALLTNDDTSGKRDTALMLAGSFLLILNVVRAAWLCDDAYITFRTIDNWVNGYGLRWNVLERAQAYTHPLWMFFLSALYVPFRSVPFAGWVGSLLTLVASIVVLGRLFRSNLAALVPTLCALAISSVFVEFSTSGLENPATHLGIALLAYEASRAGSEQRSAWQLGLVLGLMAVNRMDSVLLGFPLLLWRLYEARSWSFARPTLAAFAVLPVCWTAFSLIYYGTPFPNTALAKLGAGIPHSELIQQGLYYLFETVLYQPWSATLLVLGFVVFPFLSVEWRALLCGGGMYLAYIVWIGGDFMQGRFLSGPVLLSAICVGAALATFPRERTFATARAALILAIALVVWPEFSGNSGWRSDRVRALNGQGSLGTVSFSGRGVADERAVYVAALGIENLRRNHSIPNWPWFLDGRKARSTARTPGTRKPLVIAYSVIGMYGYAAGPDVHIVDQRALPDPFLARLPARYTPDWRTGHYDRLLPAGYMESVQRGTCELTSRELCAGLERVFRVTRGPLWSWQRAKDIFTLWTSRFVDRAQEDRLRHPEMLRIGLEDLGPRLAPGHAWNEHYRMPLDGVQIDLRAMRHERKWSFGFDHNDQYEVQIRRRGTVVESHVVGPDGGGGLVPMLVELSTDASAEGYDNLRILGKSGDGIFGLAYAIPEP